jgi:hypothetical protein
MDDDTYALMHRQEQPALKMDTNFGVSERIGVNRRE